VVYPDSGDHCPELATKISNQFSVALRQVSKSAGSSPRPSKKLSPVV